MENLTVEVKLKEWASPELNKLSLKDTQASSNVGGSDNSIYS